MSTMLRAIDAVSSTNLPVLLLGETGVGKERMAEWVHASSPRRGRPMARVNCAAIPTSLAESEFFGCERGAYTGAAERRLGRFEQADGSTLFLDEIGEMPLDVQSKLLRVLEDGSFERLGSSRTRRVDVRVIAATNRDLDRDVTSGRFRADLLHRLSIFPLRIPPLRERRHEVLPIAREIAREVAQTLGRDFDDFDPASVERIRDHDWPGNVRELRNVLTRAILLSQGGPLEVWIPEKQQGRQPPPEGSGENLRDVVSGHIFRVLSRCSWRVRGPGGAAETLGLPPTTLESKMKRLGIQRPRRGESDSLAHAG